MACSNFDIFLKKNPLGIKEPNFLPKELLQTELHNLIAVIPHFVFSPIYTFLNRHNKIGYISGSVWSQALEIHPVVQYKIYF